MKKKSISVLLAAAMAAGCLAACGTDVQPESASTTSGSAAESGSQAAQSSGEGEKEKVTLTVMFRDSGQGEEGPAYQWMQKAAETYSSDKYDVTIELSPITASTGDYYSKIALNLSSTDACPDLILEDSFQVASDVSAGYLADLTDYLADFDEWNNGLFIESMKASGQMVDGNYYTVPICTDTRLLFFNKDVFEQAGLPTDWQPESWEDILDAARAIRDNCGDDVVPLWLSSGAAEGEATSMNSYEMLLSGCSDFLMEGDQFITSSQSILDTLNFYKTVYTEDLGAPLSVILNGSAAGTGAKEYLPAGKLGIYLDGCWTPQYYYTDGSAPWAEFEDKLGIALMPTKDGGGYTTMSGGWGLAIPENSDSKDAAFDFLKHAVTDPSLEIYLVKNGNLSVLTDNSHFTGEGLDVSYAQTPFMDEITESVQYAKFRPQDEDYPTVSTNIYTMVEAVVTGTDPQEAMDKFATDVANAIGAERTVSN